MEAPAKGDGKGKSSDKPGRTPACKFFGTDDGCKKGQDCTYQHDWSTLDKKGPPRCWTCSSTKHSKRDCTVRAMATGGGAPDAGGKGKKGGGKGKDGEGAPPAPALKKADKPEDTSKGVGSEAPASHPGGEGDSGRAPAVAAHQELLQEATTLLKTLRGPALRAIKINSLEVQGEGKTLLDGGATHALRTATDLEEWKSALGSAGGACTRLGDSSTTSLVENAPFTVAGTKHRAAGNFGGDRIRHQVGGDNL